MSSISTRLVIGTSLVLSVFVILTALSVSYSVRSRAETARFDRMQGLIYGILGATEISANPDDGPSLLINELELPDARLNQATTGLYSEIISRDGAKLWQSRSMLVNPPLAVVRPIGDWLFETVEGKERNQPPVSRLQLSTAWAFDNGEELPFIVHVVDRADNLLAELKRFDRTLWATLLASALALLIVQLLVLKRSLKPLEKIGDEVKLIERGERDSLSSAVPTELLPLSSGLNALLRAERARHAQYRHLIDDLAHSLKTPLSVLQNEVEKVSAEKVSAQTPDSPEIKQTSIKPDVITTEIDRIRESLNRSVQRAHIKAPSYLAPLISTEPAIRRVVSSLEKLYQQSGIRFELDIDDSPMVRMDNADLLELFGNVADNACKYGATEVTVTASASPRYVIFRDNGPGFPEGKLSILTQRGARADTQAQGQGMGLAAVRQMMESHGGSVSLANIDQGVTEGAADGGAVGGAEVRLVW